jgi:PKD repeat protein|tara:strand:- start:490 stop:1692 length:1203 start_codon:yes stop_codon:yes gene_type:complete
MKQKAVSVFIIFAMCSIAFSGCTETFASNQPPEISLKVSPSGVIKAEETITFDASATIDRDGDNLIFLWDFDDSDGIQREESGSEVTWEYNLEGTYIVTLTVEDGQFSQTKTVEIEIIPKDSIRPEADAGSRMGVDDCDGEETSDSSREFYLYFICEEKENNDREIDATTDVVLDGSASTHDDPSHYLSKYEWDLDVNIDADGDGDSSNDVDATGETYTWKDLPPGKWEVQLTVTDDRGLQDSDEVIVYINYVGEWTDFTVGRNASGSDNILEFEFNTVYEDSPSVNKVKRIDFELTYPQKDPDGSFWGDAAAAQTLDIYVYNNTKEPKDVTNTSSVTNDQRTGNSNFECDTDEDYCIFSQISGSYHVKKYYSGPWSVEIVNTEQNEADAKKFTIRITFK